MSEDEDNSPDVFENIRDVLGPLIGQKLVDITQSDEEEERDFLPYVMFMFEDGSYVKFPMTKHGFCHNVGPDE